MKKFVFGLIVGLIVGFLGVLAYHHGVGNADEDTKSEGLEGAVKRRKGGKSKLNQEGLDIARVKLRTVLDGQAPEKHRALVLDFLDAAIFNRSWDDVSAAAEFLHKHSPSPKAQGPKTINKAAQATEPSAESVSKSPIVLYHELQEQAFWNRMAQNDNEAQSLRAESDADKRLAGWQRLLLRPAADLSPQARSDAAHWLAREGDNGLRILIGMLRKLDQEPRHGVLILAIARSGHAQAVELLLQLTSDQRSKRLNLKAIRALGHCHAVILGNSEANARLIELAQSSDSEKLRFEALKVLTRMDLSQSKDLQKQLVALMADSSESLNLRAALVRNLKSYAEINIQLPVKILRGLEQLARSEQDNSARSLAFQTLAMVGDKHSYEQLQGLESSIRSAPVRQDYQDCLNQLKERFDPE